MTNKNGYVIEMLADSQLFGPYVTYDDALVAFNIVMGHTAEDNPARIRAIESAPESVIVDDCGRSECRHCRSMEKDARKAIAQKVIEENSVPVGVDPNKKHIFDEMGIEVKTLDE